MNEKAKIGVAGLGVMGENLALNLADHKIMTAVWNRTPERMRGFLSRAGGEKAHLRGCETVGEFTGALEKPRRILLMVKAGKPVDDCIASLLPSLERGDIIIDGGNSHYPDTARRERELAEHGVRFVGLGVSGGEEGARRGPALMPGGDSAAWPEIETILKTIAARAEDDSPCCAWIGPEGAGHFVKMVHNGIEYADMQLLAEGYGCLRGRLGLKPAEAAAVFRRWNNGPLQGYLTEITGKILDAIDPETDAPLIEKILDSPGQKGTGQWTSESALALGEPIPTLTAALYERLLNADKIRRETGARLFPDAAVAGTGETPPFTTEELEAALYGAKICAYAQGFALLKTAGERFNWRLDFGSIARIWRSGCIIRARFLDDIARAFECDPALDNLMFDPFFRDALTRALPAWRRCVASGILAGIPLPALSSALEYFDSIRTAHSAANLIQAQRDFFGAHTYERTDRPRGEFFHTDWSSTSLYRENH